MNSVCSHERLELALAGLLNADDESTLHLHLDECELCAAEIERLSGGERARKEIASMLVPDELDDALPLREECSTSDFVVDHLEPSDDPAVLGRLGTYDVLDIIGRGGMGVVLKGFDRELKRFVAIKALAPHLAHSALARKRFGREAQAAAAVVNLHVIAIHQVQPSGQLPFLVMPLLTGESLAQRLTARGTLELTEILRIGMQAAEGLAAAHGQGLIHRDVKPANILLEKGVERAVLTDFGLARAADDVSVTRWGIIAGTPEYMSPEQARGQTLDGRSDLFSLGCVLYEMATGVSPFRTDSTMATLRRIVDEQPAAIASLAPELPPWFSYIVERLLSKDPTQRFAHAGELSQLLEQCLSHLQQPAFVSLPASLVPHATGRRSIFNVTRKGVFAMLGTIGMTLLGMVLWQATEAPDISGEWTSDEWGTVVLEAKAPGRHDVFAPWHGNVIEVRVENGQTVRQGEIVLALRSDDLDTELVAARNLASVAMNKLINLARERARAVDTGHLDEVTRIDTEIATTEAQRDGAIDKAALIQRRIEALQIRSPVDGVVATFQVKQNLLDRPVRRGDRLFEIMKFDGPWQYEGTFTGSDKGKSGTVRLQWSRVERRFNGTWRKDVDPFTDLSLETKLESLPSVRGTRETADDRNGKMSLRLVDKEIRGAWTTSKVAQKKSGTPRLADLLWTRSVVTVPDGGTVLLGGPKTTEAAKSLPVIELPKMPETGAEKKLPSVDGPPVYPKLADDRYAKSGVPLAEQTWPMPPWGAEKGGLSAGILIIGDARIGGEVKAEFWVRNSGAKDVTFSQCHRADVGLSVVAKDKDGKEHSADITSFRGRPSFSHWLLPPGHIVKVKQFTLKLGTRKNDELERGWVSLDLPPGDYKLRVKWSDSHALVTHAGDWTGELTTDDVDLKIAVADAGADAAKPAAKPPGTTKVSGTESDSDPRVPDENGIYWSDQNEDNWVTGMKVVQWPTTVKRKLVVEFLLRNNSPEAREIDVSLFCSNKLSLSLSGGNKASVDIPQTESREKRSAASNGVLQFKEGRAEISFASLESGEYTLRFGPYIFMRRGVGNSGSGVPFDLSLPVTFDASYDGLPIHWGEPVAGLRLGAMFLGAQKDQVKSFKGTVSAQTNDWKTPAWNDQPVVQLLVQNVSQREVDCRFNLPLPIDGWKLHIADSAGQQIQGVRGPVDTGVDIQPPPFHSILAPGKIVSISGEPQREHAQFAIVPEKPSPLRPGQPVDYVLPAGDYTVRCSASFRKADSPDVTFVMESAPCPFHVGATQAAARVQRTVQRDWAVAWDLHYTLLNQRYAEMRISSDGKMEALFAEGRLLRTQISPDELSALVALVAKNPHVQSRPIIKAAEYAQAVTRLPEIDANNKANVFSEMVAVVHNGELLELDLDTPESAVVRNQLCKFVGLAAIGGSDKLPKLVYEANRRLKQKYPDVSQWIDQSDFRFAIVDHPSDSPWSRSNISVWFNFNVDPASKDGQVVLRIPHDGPSSLDQVAPKGKAPPDGTAKPTARATPKLPKLPDEAYTTTGIHCQKFRGEDAKRPGGRLMGDVVESQRGEDPLVLGMRVASDAKWNIGGQVRVELVVRNASGSDVKFPQTPRADNGLSVVVIDKDGKEHQAEIAKFRGRLTLHHLLLPRAHVVMVKSFTLRFDPEKRGVSESGVAAFHLPPGAYTLRCKWNDARPEVAHEGEWTGELVSVEHQFTLTAAPAASEK